LQTKHITTLGAGSWGTALAAHLCTNGHTVCLWGRDPAQMGQMHDSGINSRYLPGIDLPASLTYSSDLQASVAQSDVIVIATPCHSFKDMLTAIKPTLQSTASIIWACKGITDNQLLHSVVNEQLGGHYPAAIVSGPSFAFELVRGLPTAATVAAEDMAFASLASSWFHNDTFRAYASDDIIGVQIAGALKNVYAIAAGIADGLGYGANARAALITRGLAELMRLGVAMGAKPETLMGLSGVGDLVLTCTDNQSRNRRYGLAIGEGQSNADAIKSIGQVVEGINTSQQAAELAALYKIDMPITEEVYSVVHSGKDPRAAVADLLGRSQKIEMQ